MNSKSQVSNQPVDPPNLAGINPQLVDSQQATIPSTYFAGARRLKLLWIMNPVDFFTTTAGKSSKKDTGTNQARNYYGSIAAIINCGQLDTVWGITKDDGVVWPKTEAWISKAWPAHSYVVDKGRIWTNGGTVTSAEPPNAPWTMVKVDISSNPTQFAVSGYGDIWIYKGTANQVLDPAAEVFLTTYSHPPYRYRAIACVTRFFFGTDVQSPPNLAILGARNPVQSIITGAASNIGTIWPWRCNPWAIIAELLTHPVYGAGMLPTLFHAASWQAEADWCYDRETGTGVDQVLTYIAPIYESQTKVRSIIADLLAYVDGFVFWGTDGLLHAGHWPHGEAAPGGMTDLNWDDVVDEIGWDTEGWQGTSNSGFVNFNDAQAAFQSNSVPVMNGYNRQITKRIQTISVDRPFITSADQAASHGAEIAKINAEPYFNADIVCRYERVSNLNPGDLFTLTDDLVQVTKVCRLLKKTIHAQPAGLITLTIQSERGIADVPYQGTPPTPTNFDFPSPSLITNFQLFQLPASLSGAAYEIACIAGRNDAVTTRLDVWWKYAGASFQDLDEQSTFAVAGALDSTSNGADVVHEVFTASSTQGNTYSLANSDIWNLTVEYDSGGGYVAATLDTHYTADLTAGTITILTTGGAIVNGSHVRANYSNLFKIAVASGTPQIDIDSISSSQTSDEIDDNTILLFVSQSAIISHEVFTASSTQGNTYALVHQNIYSLTVEFDSGGGYGPATLGVDYTADLLNGKITIVIGGGIPNASHVRANYSFVPPFEIMAVKEVVAAGGGVYNLKVRRQRYGTAFGGDGSYVFTTADPAFVIPRANISQFTHVLFRSLYAAFATATFRLTPGTAWKLADVLDVYDAGTNPTGLTTETSLTFGDPWKPTAAWTALLANTGTAGAWQEITTFASAFAPATKFQFTAQLFSPVAELASYSIATVVGTVRTIVDSGPLVGQTVNKTFSLTLTDVAQYRLELTVKDKAGRDVTIPLTLVATPNVEETLLIQAASPTQTATPDITLAPVVGSSGSLFTATITCATGGATIKYQVQDVGVAPVGGSYVTYSAAFRVGAHKAVYSYATHGGLSDSNVATAITGQNPA